MHQVADCNDNDSDTLRAQGSGQVLPHHPHTLCHADHGALCTWYLVSAAVCTPAGHCVSYNINITKRIPQYKLQLVNQLYNVN